MAPVNGVPNMFDPGSVSCSKLLGTVGDPAPCGELAVHPSSHMTSSDFAMLDMALCPETSLDLPHVYRHKSLTCCSVAKSQSCLLKIASMYMVLHVVHVHTHNSLSPTYPPR